MSNIKTETHLQDALDSEFAWRIKEISTLKILVKTGRGIHANTAVRAGIPILYAHWEGFIKKSATYYLEYINNQRFKYKELKSCFVVFGIKRHINALVESKSSSVLIEALEFIRANMDERAKLKVESAIRTEFNLSSKVFSNIGKALGLQLSWYEPRYNLIDESLLNRRNTIAHGEYLDVDANGFRDLADEVILLLRTFKTDIENAVSLQSFKSAA
ncbi:MAG: MAE_28990/MAE_18760 family HEPN-like nuclease [Desulfurivibrionaceae bacterium]|jgi:hypothetical protein